MPVAVEMFLDDATSSVIRQIWRELADARVARSMEDLGARPHITLGIYEGVEYPEFEERLESFTADLTPFEIDMESIGIFPTDRSVVFLAPHISSHILSLKSTFHEIFEDVGSLPWEFYHPRHWVPHCTLASEIGRAEALRAVEICLNHPVRLHGRVETFGMVKFPPIEVMRTFRLGAKPKGK
jgi:2'-5' RNA ligase